MTRAEQFERYAAREGARLREDHAAGLISSEDYNADMQNLEREGRAAYEEDVYEAERAIADEWNIR